MDDGGHNGRRLSSRKAIFQYTFGPGVVKLHIFRFAAGARLRGGPLGGLTNHPGASAPVPNVSGFRGTSSGSSSRTRSGRARTRQDRSRRARADHLQGARARGDSTPARVGWSPRDELGRGMRGAGYSIRVQSRTTAHPARMPVYWGGAWSALRYTSSPSSSRGCARSSMERYPSTRTPST